MLLGRFSNLRGLKVIDCLFLILSSFLKLQSPGGLKPPLMTSLTSGSSQGRYAKLSGMTTGLSQQLCSRGLVALDG